MARPWRIQYKGATYHVMSRGIEGGVIFPLGRYSGLNNKRIGEVFGVRGSAVSKAIIRVSKQLNDKKELKNKVDKILNSTFKV